MKYLSIILLFGLLSCSKREVKPDCDCEGTSTRELKPVKAAYVGKLAGNGVFQFVDPESNYLQSVQLCENTLIDSTWQADPKRYSYTLSGEYKRGCPLPPGLNTLIALTPLLKATRIVKE